jgi:hypothetical protein
MSTDDDATIATNHTPSALVRAVSEIEQHVGADGWDQPPRLYALAPTLDLIDREPNLADQLDVDVPNTPDDSLTPIEQEIGDRPIEDLLASIAWPDTVTGCALVIERIVLPPGVEDDMPDDTVEASQWAQNHPERADVRLVVGVLRDGERTSVLRVRGHEDEGDLIRDSELAPELGEALAETFV